MLKAIWAIDPFESQARPNREMVKGFLEWIQATKVEIQPVHILTIPAGEDASFLYSQEGLQVIAGATEATEQYLREFEVQTALPVKIILGGHGGVQNYVPEFLDYAETIHPNFQIVSSRTQSGLDRFVKGSFSEKLLIQSRQPVVFLSHFVRAEEDEKKQAHRRAVFSTDFSDYSREAFVQFLEVAHKLQIGIDLYHVVSLPAGALTSEYGVPFVIPEDYFPSQVEWARAEAEIWAKIAKAQGVTLTIAIESGGIGPHIAAMILDFAELRNANIIVLGSLSGPFKSFVMGSVAKDIYRSNQYAVWMYGPNSLERQKTADVKKDEPSLAQA